MCPAVAFAARRDTRTRERLHPVRQAPGRSKALHVVGHLPAVRRCGGAHAVVDDEPLPEAEADDVAIGAARPIGDLLSRLGHEHGAPELAAPARSSRRRARPGRPCRDAPASFPRTRGSRRRPRPRARQPRPARRRRARASRSSPVARPPSRSRGRRSPVARMPSRRRVPSAQRRRRRPRRSRRVVVGVPGGDASRSNSIQPQPGSSPRASSRCPGRTARRTVRSPRSASRPPSPRGQHRCPLRLRPRPVPARRHG